MANRFSDARLSGLKNRADILQGDLDHAPDVSAIDAHATFCLFERALEPPFFFLKTGNAAICLVP
jgi:hypothetical protein